MRRFLALVCCLLMLGIVSSQERFCPEGYNDCDWLEWGQWSTCGKECGRSTKSRNRNLCCDSIKDYDKCRQHCGLDDNSVDTEECYNVCPTGNCTFDMYNNTGLEATNYLSIKDGILIRNPPMMLNTNPENCAQTCLNFHLNNGMRCWTYELTSRGCEIFFYPTPLDITHQDQVGKSPGKSVYLRHCQEVQPCRATMADVILIVDSSGSIGPVNFEKIKSMVQNIVNRFDIDTDLTRVGLLLYNEYFTWSFKLGEINDKLTMLKTIRNLKYVVGGTLTHQALDEARLNGFTNTSRPGVPQIAIVITDGLSRYPGITKLRAKLLRNDGVQVYALGVGNQTNVEELYNIASSPENEFVMQFEDFDDLDLGNSTFNVSYVPCKDEVINLNETTTTVQPTASNCTDKVPNCADYGRDVCTDYAPWAHANCAKYCEFCQGPPQTVGPCIDTIPNCASYGKYVCADKAYVSWVEKNCRKHCEICVDGIATTTTTPIPTTTVQICEDTITNCYGYKDNCHDQKYKPYLQAHCPETCGYCKSYQSVVGHHMQGMAPHEKCPDWWLPTECSMVKTTDSCCPLPKCPSSYYTTAELDLSGV